MKCDCDHPRNDDGLHASSCSLIAFNEAVERAAAEALAEMRADYMDFVKRTKKAIADLGGKWPKGPIE